MFDSGVGMALLHRSCVSRREQHWLMLLMSMAPLGGMSTSQSTLFWRQGYLMFPGFASESTVSGLRANVETLLQLWEPGMITSNSSAARASLRFKEPDHSFLLESATKTSFFLEADAVEAAINGSLTTTLKKRRAVRKVGHGIHLSEGALRNFALSEAVAKIAFEVGLRQPAIVQTLVRLAPPLAPGVDRHQDSTTLYTDPPSVLGFWLALEDADESNGCLRIKPFSHLGPIRERLVRETSCNVGITNSSSANCRPKIVFKRLVDAPKSPEADFVPIPMKLGDLLVMHGSLEHFSAAGVDDKRSRESFQIHVVEAEAKWAHDNWLQYPPGIEFVRLPARKLEDRATQDNEEL